MYILTPILSLITGWSLDKIFGDPPALPHPIVGFGKLIAKGERWLNRGKFRLLKGAVMAITLVLGIYICTYTVLQATQEVGWPWLYYLLSSVLVFYCLAGTTLIREVRAVFRAVERSTETGRKQVSRIVGRDTHTLSSQEIRTAALETLAENLSDGVVAPLFWYLLLGVPGMMAYKMVNTLDSMIGYRT